MPAITQTDSRTIDRAGIELAARTIAGHVRRTPVVEADGEDFGLPGVSLAFKLELLQHAGSFKARGAFTNLLLRDVPEAGVVAASGGNHGAAVAFAAMKLGVPAKIFVPVVSSAPKIARIRAYGAELVVTGERYGEALEGAQAWARQTGALPIHAFDEYETMLGTGTIARELDEQLAAYDTVLAAVGGGGLIGGMAAWYAGGKRVVGVEPEGAPTLTRALEAGRPVDAPTESIANDSLAPLRVGDMMFPIAQRHIDRVLLVSDDDIRAAQESLWRNLTVVAEPGGAAAFAAVLAKRYVPQPGERLCIAISGGNSAAVAL
jgi:threonine dehydratase